MNGRLLTNSFALVPAKACVSTKLPSFLNKNSLRFFTREKNCHQRVRFPLLVISNGIHLYQILTASASYLFMHLLPVSNFFPHALNFPLQINPNHCGVIHILPQPHQFVIQLGSEAAFVIKSIRIS